MIGQLARVQIDWHVEVMRALPEGQEALIVEIVTGRLAVDQRPFESELTDRPFELDGGGHRILHRHGGETSIAARPVVYLPRPGIVDLSRQIDGPLRGPCGLAAR